MNPISIPDSAKAGRPDCQVVSMGPPPGVDDEDCGTVEMLVSLPEEVLPNVPGRRQYAYYRPTRDELEQLRNGGFIEFVQLGRVVQPFGAAVWPGPSPAVLPDKEQRR